MFKAVMQTWCFHLPNNCEDSPEESVNLWERSREDVADAMDSGDLRVLLQRLHQGASFSHAVLRQSTKARRKFTSFKGA